MLYSKYEVDTSRNGQRSVRSAALVIHGLHEGLLITRSEQS